MSTPPEAQPAACQDTQSHAVDSGLPWVGGRELDFAHGGDEHGIVRVRGGLPADARGAIR
jgi:hypothetical protein